MLGYSRAKENTEKIVPTDIIMCCVDTPPRSSPPLIPPWATRMRPGRQTGLQEERGEGEREKVFDGEEVKSEACSCPLRQNITT